MMSEMRRSGFLFWIFFLFHIDINSSQVSHPYVVSIKLRLKDEGIPRLIAESMLGNNAMLSPYFDYSEVSLSDFQEVIGATEVTVEDVFKELDIDLVKFHNVISRRTIIDIVDVAEINIHHLYSTFVQHFVENPLHNIPKILRSLNVNSDAFTSAVVFGTDQDMLNILLEGSYSIQNVEHALEFINLDITLNQALAFLTVSKLEGLANLKNSNSTAHLIHFINSLIGIDKVMNVFRLLTIGADNFYRNVAFTTILNNAVDTGEELIGSLVSPDEIVTNSDSKTLVDYIILKKFTGLVAKAVENLGVQHPIADCQIPKNPSVLVLTAARKFNFHSYLKYPLSREIENLGNCYCIFVDPVYNSLRSVSVEVTTGENGTFTVNKTDNIVFNIGSPLVCAEYLYGVAYWDYDTTISFLSVVSRTEAESESRGYVALAIDFVKQLPTLVADRFCKLFQTINLNIC